MRAGSFDFCVFTFYFITVFPILFKIGPMPIYSYGALLALGFLLASFILWRHSREAGFDEEKVMDYFIVSSLVAFVTARITHIITHWPAYTVDLSRIFNLINYPGLTELGAYLGGFVCYFIKIKKEKRVISQHFDILALSVSFFTVFVSLGCFLNGCLQGLQTNWVVGIRGPDDLFRRHPVALYGFILTLIIYLFLKKAIFRFKTFEWYGSGKDGFVFFSFLGLTGLKKMALELFYQDRLYWGGISIGQFFGLAIFLGGFIAVYRLSGASLLLFFKKRTKKPESKFKKPSIFKKRYRESN